MPRMTTERYFGGVEGRIDNLGETLEWIAEHHPGEEEQLITWVKANTPAGSDTTI